MKPSEQLRFGPYKTPRFKLGQVVYCAMRGEVTIAGLTDGRIPWPLGKRGRVRAFVLYGDLAKAVKHEANVAVCYWWGVTPQTVTKWRAALDVGPITDGTQQVLSEGMTTEKRLRMEYGRLPTYLDPARNEKIRQSRLGKPRPKHVHKKLRAANKGKRWSPERHQRRLDAWKELFPNDFEPLTAAEERAIRLMTVEAAVRATGRSEVFILKKRKEFGVAKRSGVNTLGRRRDLQVCANSSQTDRR